MWKAIRENPRAVTYAVLMHLVLLALLVIGLDWTPKVTAPPGVKIPIEAELVTEDPLRQIEQRKQEEQRKLDEQRKQERLAQEKAAALTYLTEILGGSGATSVLGQKLQFETQLAVYTTAYYDGSSLDETNFGLGIFPVEGVSLAEAEAALDRVLAEFMAEGIDDAQFERIKFQIRAAQIYAEDDIQGLARRYGDGRTDTLPPLHLRTGPERRAHRPRPTSGCVQGR